MASATVLHREHALAQQEAFETIQRLLTEVLGDEVPSERFSRARDDVVGRTMPDLVSDMQIAELVRVVAAQQERIQRLEEQLADNKPTAKK